MPDVRPFVAVEFRHNAPTRNLGEESSGLSLCLPVGVKLFYLLSEELRQPQRTPPDRL
jgi:hypothetical protein